VDLTKILDPITKREFFTNYWNQKPLVVKGSGHKFDDLPPKSALPKMSSGSLDDNYWSETSNLTAHASTVNGNGKLVQLNNVPISMYAQLYNSGYSLCFNDVSYADERFRELVEDTQSLSDLRASVSVTCYLSPPNSNGVLHFDHQHVFFMQREGAKYWRVSENPAIKNPVENFLYPNADQEYLDEMELKGYAISVPSQCGFQDIKLETGDLLYMPPGFYHAPHTQESNSFHYTLTLDTVSFWNMLMSSMRLELLKNCSSFNYDVRVLGQADRKRFFERQLEKIKTEINSMTVEDIEKAYQS